MIERQWTRTAPYMHPTRATRLISAFAMSPLDPRASRLWDSAYHGQHEQRRADGGSAFPTLWGTPWDVFYGKLGKCMPGEALTEIVVLPLPERERRDVRLGGRFRAAMRTLG